MRLSIIAALDRNGLIGDERGLPWHLPRDLRRFRELTWSQAVVMGRTTHEHIGRPLPGRQNIVLSRQTNVVIPNCDVATSLQDALAKVAPTIVETFFIGGGQVYREVLPRADRMYLTVVDGTFSGTTWFPCELVQPSEWAVSRREFCGTDDKNPYRHAFLVVDRHAVGQSHEQPFDLRQTLAAPFEFSAENRE
jgi:dihydrofolate reductase